MDPETHPGASGGTDQPLTRSDLPLHMPAFHPSYSSSWGLLKEYLGNVSFPSPTVSSPGKHPRATRNPPRSSEVIVDLPEGKGGTYNFAVQGPYALTAFYDSSLYPKPNSQHKLTLSPLGRRGDRSMNQLFICLEDAQVQQR